jgi:hypothetical protein
MENARLRHRQPFISAEGTLVVEATMHGSRAENLTAISGTTDFGSIMPVRMPDSGRTPQFLPTMPRQSAVVCQRRRNRLRSALLEFETPPKK